MQRAIALLLLCEFLATGHASAQGAPAQAPPPQTNASPIEVTAQPEHAALGTSVTIQGTVAVKGSNAVTITIKPPAGAPFSHSVSADANGAFTLQYPDTKTPGAYSVQASIGASSAAATFGVGSADIAQNAIQGVQEILGTADSMIREGKRQYAGNPALAGRNRAATDQQIAQLQRYIAQARKLWTPSPAGSPAGPPTLADMLLEITAQLQSRPDLAARYAPELNRLQAWSEQNKTSMKHFRSHEPLLRSIHSMNRQHAGILTPVSFRLAEAEAEAPAGGAGTCETAQQVGEFFEMAGSILSLVGTPLTVGLNLVFQFAGQQVGSPTGIPVAEHGALAAQEVQEWQHELHDVLNPISWDAGPSFANMPTGLKITAATVAAHLAAAIADSFLHGVCGEFTGPFQATMRAVAKIYGHPWWKFKVDVAGKLTLHFPILAWEDHARVPFTGEFEGQGTNFTVWEDAVPVLYKKLFQPGMTISWHKVSATRVTNLSLCHDCVVPLRGVAVASEDFGTNGDFGGLSGVGQTLPNTLALITGRSATPGFGGATAGTEDVGVSGQPTNIGISLFPGLKSLLSKPGLNLFSAAYFRIPVQGKIETNLNGNHADFQGNISLTVLPARNDWDPDLINAHVKYLVITSGLPLGVPLLLDFGLPYPSAEFILKRALGNTTPGPANGNTTINMANALVPNHTGSKQDFDAVVIRFQNVNNMPETQVPDADQNKTGQADYNITLTATKQAKE
jgi:hypothetical protein